MQATEICPLSRRTVAGLIKESAPSGPGRRSAGRRRAPRWPFPGTVELWLTNEAGEEDLALATCQNLSKHGVGIICDEWLAPGEELAIAIHQPARSLHGRAVVRHCTNIQRGFYAGLEFIFEKRGRGCSM